MEDQPEEKLFSMGQLLLITIAFSVYAIILLSLDPEWVLWAGSMSLGSLYVPDPPPRLFDDPRKVLQIASDLFHLFLVALFGLLCLVGFMGGVKFGWLSWLKARWAEWRSQSARGGGELGEISAEARFEEVDRDPGR